MIRFILSEFWRFVLSRHCSISPESWNLGALVCSQCALIVLLTSVGPVVMCPFFGNLSFFMVNLERDC